MGPLNYKALKEFNLCMFLLPQPCSPNGLHPSAAHQRHLAFGPDGGQQRRDDLPLPVRRLQLPAGSPVDRIRPLICNLLDPLSALWCVKSYVLSSQGVFIFFFHVVFSKEVRRNLKNVFTGKKNIPDDSSTTRASLLTVSECFGAFHYFLPQMYASS